MKIFVSIAAILDKPVQCFSLGGSFHLLVFILAPQSPVLPSFLSCLIVFLCYL